MASDLSSCLRQLKSCLDSQYVPQSRNIVSRVNQLIVERTDETQAEIDFNLECVFTAQNGLVSFLQTSFSKAKHFSKVNEDLFELFRKIVQKHSSSAGKWMTPVVSIALRYIQSSSVSARERELATLTLQDCIAYGCLRRECYAALDALPDELLLVFQQRKLPARFQQYLYELLGQLAKTFPECINDAPRLRDVFLHAAESQLLEENYPSLVSLAGIVRGLDHFFVNFAPTEDERDLRKRLYVLVKKLSIWDEGRSEKVVFRTALQLLANHAPLFTVHLYEDHVYWHTVLSGRWIKSNNRDDQRVALAALYAFHGEVARVLSTPELTSGSQRECQPTGDVLNQYLGYYRKLLNAASSDRCEVRIAIRGFGIMARPCQLLADSSASLNELLSIVLERIEGICWRSATVTSSTVDTLDYLPDFMQALSEILTHTDHLSSVQLVSLQTMAVALVRDFHHIPNVHHDLIVRSLVCTLDNISKLGGSGRDQLLDNILLQGIVWTCSHALPFGDSPPVSARSDEAPRKVDWKRELVTYKNYLPLWHGLLAARAVDNDASLTSAVYRAFMRTLFVIVEKLDLSTRKRTFQDEDGQQRELFFCDPNIDLLPTKPKDYHIFLNLVELYRDVVHGTRTPATVRWLFAEWIRPYFERFVRQSLQSPLVSGFVKFIEMGLRTAEHIGYFDNLATDDNGANATLMLLVHYLEQTIQRSLHSVGELQLACLRFVLNAPVRLLTCFLEDEERKQPMLVEVFRTSFRLGHGLLSIARAALGSLQRIVRFHQPPLGAKFRGQLLRQALPMVEPFLRTRDSAQPPAQSLRLAKYKRLRTANMTAQKIEHIKQQYRIEQAIDASELVAFQMRILNLFADLQPNECCWLMAEDRGVANGMESEETEGSSLTRWDAEGGRSLELQLRSENGTRPSIKLDGIVGRVCLLAVECSDRSTKLAACELLHTIVLYVLNIHYQDLRPDLWTQLCRQMLQLSCDTDLAVCQMFEPLLFQIIHFLTQPSKLGQQGTTVLLNCLMDATVNVQQSNVRDLAVRCLREFLQWTNRQSGGSLSVTERNRIKCTLLEQLKTHAIDSNGLRRYGSALAFNNLFRLLVQENYHIVRYGFELMHSYAVGFMATEDVHGLHPEGSSGGSDAALEQFQLVLKHLARLLEERKVLLNGHGKETAPVEHRRIIPPDIGGGRMEDLLRWLFRQCAARQQLYRRKCMHILPRLARTVQDVADVESFVRNHFTPQRVEEICLQADVAQGIDRAPTLMSLRDERTHSPVTNVYLWLEHFLATLDMFCWMRRDHVIPDQLSQGLLIRILPAVQCLLRTVVDASMYELTALIKRDVAESHPDQRINADKIVRFDALKSAVVVQIVDLFCLLLDPRTAFKDVCDHLWQDKATIDFLLALVLKQHPLGLDGNVRWYHELEDNARFWNQMDTLLQLLTEGPSWGLCFTSALSEKLILVVENLGDRMQTLLEQRTINVLDQLKAKGLLFLAKHHQNRPGDNPLVTSATAERFQRSARKLLMDCYEAIGLDSVRLALSPSAARFGTMVLRAVLQLSDDPGTDAESGLVQPTLSCCLNEDLLVPNIQHGEHFLACFGPAMFELFFAKPSKCFKTLVDALKPHNFSMIVRLLCGMMEYVYRVHASDTDRLRHLSETLLVGWDPLFECSRQQPNRFGACDLQMIELMSTVAMVCPFPLFEIHLKTGPSYERWLAGLIGGSLEVPLGTKTKAIVLLPTVLGVDRPSATEPHLLEDALERLQTLHFPLRSTEFPPNSPERVAFLNCLERLLDALVVSRSPVLLSTIVQMTAPDGEGNIAETQIRSAVELFFADQTPELQRDRLQELWELFANYSYAPAVRATILRRYLCTGLWRCRYDSVVEFYRRNIRAISSTSSAEINDRSGWDLEHALVDRAAGFRMVEHYAALLPKTTLLAEDCPVAQELYGPALDSSVQVRGQRLVMDFSKRAHSVRRVPFRGDDRVARELFRKYQCAAYRALVALVSNTNDNARMYSALLFQEHRGKGELLWRHLIDCSDDDLYLEGGQELDRAPRTVEKYVAIRREGPHPSARTTGDPGQTVVTESSLSQQMSRYDLNHSVILSAQELARRDAAALERRQKGHRSKVPLERSRINDHEAMATVCGCVRHMVASKISLDAVVHFIATSLADTEQHKNVRLFLAKVIDNCRQELTPHGATLLKPLIQLLVDDRVFRGLNTLATDLVALVLEWGSLPRRKPREGAVDEYGPLVSVLLRFMMRCTCQLHGTAGAQQQVFRLNLELIKRLVAQWHEVLTVPAELLFEMVASRRDGQMADRTQFELTAGLQLSTIVLIDGRDRLEPWMESTRQEYLQAVCRCLDEPNSAIYKPAAQLLGLCLARLHPDGAPEGNSQEGGEEPFYAACIAKLSKIRRMQERKCIEILYEASKAFPSIADPFLSVISFRVPGAVGSEKAMCLELLLGGRLESFGDELYREIASLDLALLLRDVDLQLSTLHLLNRSLPLVRDLQHLQQLIDPVGQVATERTTRSECRAIAYEILIYIHDNRAEDLPDLKRDSVWRYLLRGLCDPEQAADGSVTPVRARILEYLMESRRLPDDVKERFLYVLSDLYDPTVEADFLGCAVALLLDPAIRSREAKDRLFVNEYLNEDVKFREYTIETGARQRHAMTTLTPMFADTASQRQLQSFITGRGSQMDQLIRATQFGGGGTDDDAGLFEPTQDPARFSKGRETFAMPTQHSLLFEANSLRLDRRSQRTGPVPSDTTVSTQERTFERLRKRILKDSEQSRRQHADWAVSRHHANQRQQKEQRRESVSKVTLYRRYRLADYPDLQINLLAFLLPLQALCGRDKACARQTFVAVFNGLVECVSPEGSRGAPGNEWDGFVARLDRSMHHILESTRTCDPNLFGALVELTLGKASGRLTLAPRTVASVAGVSNMLTMGVLYLEGKLADAPEFDEEPVRSVGHRNSEAEHWLQLSALYHTLREHSIVAGIFGDKQDSDPQLREAIELEALGRYDRAHRAYCELIVRINPAREEERNFCYKSAYECLLQLGRWDDLLDTIDEQLSRPDELWTDDWNQENLLPSYVHGNVRLNLAGDEAGREFCRLLEEWMHIPDRAEHLRTHFGEQLTALQIACGETVRARLFAERTQRQFLEEWHCAGVLSEVVRLDCLLGLRRVVELLAYAGLTEQQSVQLGGLIASWRHAVPAVTDSLVTWDTFIAYRWFLVGRLERECPSVEGLSELSTMLFELQLHLLDVAFAQNNVGYAKKLIARLRKDEERVGVTKPRTEQILRGHIARRRYDRLRLTETSSSLSPELLKGFHRLAKLTVGSSLAEDEPDLAKAKNTAWTELFHYSETIRGMAASAVRPEDSSALMQTIGTTMGHSEQMTVPAGPEELRTRMKEFSLHCLRLSVDVLLDQRRRGPEVTGSTASDLADAHLRLARYCYDELDPARSETEELPTERLLVTSLLPAMRFGSREARDLFPVVLQLRNLRNDALRQEFDELSGLVPSWNFIPWIPQLLSYMKVSSDGPDDGHFLDELFMRLVRDYPMALYFPARFLPQDSTRPFVARFRAALRFPVLDRFVEELCRVVMPNTRLTGALIELKSRLNDFSADVPSYRAFLEREIANAFPTDVASMGQVYRTAMPLVDKWNALQRLHPVDDRSAIMEQLCELEGDLQRLRPLARTITVQLEEFSPWLADFYCSGQRDGLSVELPGQYGPRDGPPGASQHAVTIVRIVPDLIVYGTLRQPILITFRGSDGRNHRFLAKCGEDLRQDQRIQQLQREISSRLRADRRCREQRLELRTYEVVPVQSDFGLLGWLDGTIALQSVAFKAGPRYNPGYTGQAQLNHQFGQFLMSVLQQKYPGMEDVPSGFKSPELYGAVAGLCPPDRIQAKFVELSQALRSNTLRRALFDMAASPESFYRLRLNFAKSLAAMNVTCWALGIGDRHLGNIVLERTTGTLVGVDFGMAFGSGTCDLPIPEMVPFRLSPQFVGVMEPMRLSGVLRKCHLYTLQCLRDSGKLLRACLEVFVREPTVDWLRVARQRADDQSSLREWNPATRVNTVRRKLNGANPKRLVAEELRLGVIAQRAEFLDGYLSLVDAAAPVSTAKAGRSMNLSTELQNEMLLELATDGRLLGMTYSGWFPWF